MDTIKDIKISVDSCVKYHETHGKSLDDIKKSIVDKYNKELIKLEKERQMYFDAREKLQDEYNVKLKRGIEAFKKAAIEGKKVEKLNCVLGELEEKANEMKEWLFNPVCKIPEFNRGYYACYLDITEKMKGGVVIEAE